MNQFSISDLQHYSGIKAHTIRIWEQRYHALSPNRSEGNTRYYDSSQLRRLLNIVSLIDAQYKVSELCTMSDKELFEKIKKHGENANTTNQTTEYYISQLIAAAISYDEAHFEKIFSNCLLRFGIKNTYINVIYPMLTKIGLMWSDNSMPPAQEHFISNLIRQKLLSAIDALPPAKSEKETWLLFLPENEFHEVGLLFSYYIIREAGKKVIYLGSNVPKDSLMSAIKEISPTHLFFFMVHYDNTYKSQKYIDALKKNAKKTSICLSGNQKLISQLQLGKGIEWIRSAEQLEKML